MKLFQPTLQFFLGLALLFLIVPTQAQNINTTLAQDINNVFNPLEKNRIPHSILLDYGFDLIDVNIFDGVMRTTNYLNTKRYSQIYTSLVSSVTAHNISGIASPTQELNEWKTLQAQSNETSKTANKASVVLTGLLYNYAKLNPNALANNKIRVVNGKYDDKYKKGVWQNPYDEKLTFAIVAPLLYINRATVEASLPATLWHSNTTVTKIDIDFGDGSGYKSLLNNLIASTTYTTTGQFTWTYRIRLSNGQYKYCRQKVIVNDANTTAQARNSACVLLDTTVTATKAYQGVFGSATLQIVYGSDDCQLRKPLIVAEGLDTGLMAQAGSIGDLDIISFFNAVDNSNSIDLRNLITNNTAFDYDVVYVNWDNGTDFIQRNAYVLEAVIDWVNDNKVGNTQNVVLGQSMGGVIARYALRDMENNNEDHDTSLYISHDAPHQGAHIPLGVLYAARNIANEFLQLPFLSNISVPVEDVGELGLATIDELLDAPAVNQLLLNTVDTNGNRTNTTHTNWQTELRNIGYPQLTRNISLSNASHCAQPQGLISNENLLDISGVGGSTIFTDIVLFVLGAGKLVGDYFDDTATFLLGFLPGSTKIDIEFKANAFPTSGTAQIYKGKLTYTKTLLWLVPITRSIFDTTENSLSSDLFIDNFPGGVNPFADPLEEGDLESNFFFGYNYNLNLNLNSNFISATSALDVGGGNTTLSESDYFRTYTTGNAPIGSIAIPFDNFTTSFNTANINEPHITFNTRNGNWLALEMDATSNNEDDFDCTYTCETTEIIGSEQLCNAQNYILDVPLNETINWSVSPSNLVTISGSGAIATLTPNTNAIGEITLTAFINSQNCTPFTRTKNIWVGKPATIVPQVPDICINLRPDDFFTLPVSDAAEDYRLSWTSPNLNINVINGGWFTNVPRELFFTSTSIGTYNVTIETRNFCGISTAQFPVTFIFCSGGGRERYAVYPNPASEYLYIEYIEDEDLDQTDFQEPITEATYELFNFSSQLIKKDVLNSDVSIDVTNYEKGRYILIIYYNDDSETHHLIFE